MKLDASFKKSGVNIPLLYVLSNTCNPSNIKQQLKKEFTAKELLGDEFGTEANVLQSALTVPFNQKKETHCDMLGMDLAIASGYNGCANIKLWTRMKNQEDTYDALDNIFRSHPYSEKRVECSKNHISKNYSFNCSKD